MNRRQLEGLAAAGAFDSLEPNRAKVMANADTRQVEDGRWVYTGQVNESGKTVRREAPKVGRNDPCPCGSGKKYKKCCGAN